MDFEYAASLFNKGFMEDCISVESVVWVARQILRKSKFEICCDEISLLFWAGHSGCRRI